MALTHFAFGRAGYAMGGGVLPAAVTDSVSAQGIAPTGSNQQTTATAPATADRPVCRVATDTAVYVAFGASPNATTAATRFFLPANAIEYFVVNVGDKAAVVTI